MFRDVSTKFWEELMNYETEDVKLFLEGSDYKLLNNDLILLQNDNLFVLGKILFWSFIHRGTWPTWFHPFHINFIMELEFFGTVSEFSFKCINDLYYLLKL